MLHSVAFRCVAWKTPPLLWVQLAFLCGSRADHPRKERSAVQGRSRNPDQGRNEQHPAGAPSWGFARQFKLCSSACIRRFQSLHYPVAAYVAAAIFNQTNRRLAQIHKAVNNRENNFLNQPRKGITLPLWPRFRDHRVQWTGIKSPFAPRKMRLSRSERQRCHSPPGCRAQVVLPTKAGHRGGATDPPRGDAARDRSRVVCPPRTFIVPSPCARGSAAEAAQATPHR